MIINWINKIKNWLFPSEIKEDTKKQIETTIIEYFLDISFKNGQTLSYLNKENNEGFQKV